MNGGQRHAAPIPAPSSFPPFQNHPCPPPSTPLLRLPAPTPPTGSAPAQTPPGQSSNPFRCPASRMKTGATPTRRRSNSPTTPQPAPPVPIRCRPPSPASAGLQKRAARFVFVNDVLVDADTSGLPEGVACMDFATALQSHPELLQRHFMQREMTLGSAKFAALHLAHVKARHRADHAKERRRRAASGGLPLGRRGSRSDLSPHPHHRAGQC